MKNSNEMFQSLLERRDRYIREQQRKRKAVIRTVMPVCGLLLVVMLGAALWQSGLLKHPEVPVQKNTSGQEDRSADSTSDVLPGNPSEEVDAVYTDKVKLPEDTSDMMSADMIGCLVYQGSVYTHATESTIEDPAIAEPLVGEYVGEATGTLDEWSSQEDWATELASTYTGPVYKVNGYSEDFRLCIYKHSGDECSLQFFDNYDGIPLHTGVDLFETRLHIPGNVNHISYLTHYDWNEGNRSNERVFLAEQSASPNRSAESDITGMTESKFEDFLSELCASPFIRIDHLSNPDFYNAEIQGHLYLHMNDGTMVELRLIEGGYVGVQDLGWIFVQMPGQLFDQVLAACQ